MKRYETKPDQYTNTQNEENTILPILEEAQRIEGSGPRKKIIWSAMPKGTKYFAFFIIFVMLIFTLLLIISVLK
ncbi:hypothetical protein DFP93_11240 [Aneurinibacillus soli]|uniref:Uncharacterized protein n=1 Tax=Aneurinibacillus soli TaxID=1500254 RepID=A0A0U5CAT0_9BACL|nr:hypothetical protein [Aneurinibacillus soli]PYE60601.1 hypothetical protein DFP93_11240 [Aneurinibacillus soli]BAU29875.1 hypothetical protein CB4_04129 [Aneurinibacillus soli]